VLLAHRVFKVLLEQRDQLVQKDLEVLLDKTALQVQQALRVFRV
jgi:hypothetical protein